MNLKDLQNIDLNDLKDLDLPGVSARASDPILARNGSLSAGEYGLIGLGCETARITSWGRQSNCLAVNDSGRVDLHGTETTLCAKVAENTPIGPEHDGGMTMTVRWPSALSVYRMAMTTLQPGQAVCPEQRYSSSHYLFPLSFH